MTSDYQPDAAVFHVQGELNAATAAGLRLELGAAVGRPAVLLDLSAVEFIDSIGFGSLVWILRKIHEHGGVVAICGADARRGVVAALVHAGLDRLVFVAASPTEGLDWLLSAHDSTRL
ncbi:MAG: STAS domain-containing protein [Acidimicrobiales bacterium]